MFSGRSKHFQMNEGNVILAGSAGAKGGTQLQIDKEAVLEHVTRHIGAPSLILGEEVSHLVELDVLCIAPKPGRPYWTLVSCGMSDRPMETPSGEKGFVRLELVLCLPADWKISPEAFKDEIWYWPFRLLKNLARFPHLYKTWFGHGHTIPHGGEYPVSYADGVPFCCSVLGPRYTLGKKFPKLILSGHEVNFMGVYPLYKEEMEFKLKKGADALFKRFERRKVTELLDLERANVCQKGKSGSGMFSDWT